MSNITGYIKLETTMRYKKGKIIMGFKKTEYPSKKVTTGDMGSIFPVTKKEFKEWTQKGGK